MSSLIVSQDDGSSGFKKYKALKQDSAPYSNEGRRAQNQDALDKLGIELLDEELSSYESHILIYLNSERKSADGWHLTEALAISADDPFLIGEAIEYYGMTGQAASLKQMSEVAREKDLYMSDHDYFKLLSLSLRDEDILFTNGESDTRPILMELGIGKRKNTVICIDWLEDNNYRQSLSVENLNLPSYSSPSQFIRELQGLNPGRNVLVSSTMNKETLHNVSPALFSDRLALSINEPVYQDNLNFFRENKLSIQKSISSITTPRLKLNYLPLLVDIYNSYGTVLTDNESEGITQTIEGILEENGLGTIKDSILK